MASRKPKKGFHVNIKKAQKLLDEAGWQLDEDLTHEIKRTFKESYSNGLAFAHADGRVLHLFTGHESEGVLYLARTTFIDKLASIQANSNWDVRHVLNLNAKKLRELLSDPVWMLNDELTDLLRVTTNDTKTGACVYSNPDGQVIHIYSRANVGGLLYLDSNEFVSRLAKLRAYGDAFRAQYGESRHILEGHFLYGEDFPQHVPALLDQIPSLFKVSREALDYSWESLDLLTRKVKHLGRKRALEPQYFAPIVAYIGECIRVRVKGKWQMVQSSVHRQVWEPHIKGFNGRLYNTFSVYYEMLDDTADAPGPISLASAVSFASSYDPNQSSNAVFGVRVIQSDSVPDE